MQCCSRMTMAMISRLWRLALVLYLLNFCNACVTSMMYLIVPLYVSNILQANEDYTGNIFAMNGLAAAITLTFWGTLTARTSPQLAFVLGALLRTLAFLCMTLFQQYYAWMFLFGVVGIADGGSSIGLTTTFSAHVPTSARGRFVTSAMCFKRLGRLFGFTLAGLVTHHYSIQVACLAATCISLFGFFVACIIPVIMLYYYEKPIEEMAFQQLASQEDTEESFAPASPESPGRFGTEGSPVIDDDEKQAIEDDDDVIEGAPTRREDYEEPVVSWSESMSSLFSASFHHMIQPNRVDDENGSRTNKVPTMDVLFDYWPLLLKVTLFVNGLSIVRTARKLTLTFRGDDLDLNADMLGYVNSISYFPDACMFIVTGYLMDKCGRKYSGVPGMIIFCVMVVLVPFTRNLSELIGVALALGLANGFTTGLVATTGADIAPPHVRAQFLGLYRTFTQLPKFFGPLLIGYMTSYFSLVAACLVCSGVGVLSLIWFGCCMEDSLNTSLVRDEQLRLARRSGSNFEMDRLEVVDDKQEILLDDESQEDASSALVASS